MSLVRTPMFCSCGADLVVWRHPKLRRASIKRMPARMIAPLMHPRRFAGIDENQSFVVLDQPRMDRDPVGPVPIDQDVAEPRDAAAAAGHLCEFDSNRSGADRVNLGHHLTSGGRALPYAWYAERPTSQKVRATLDVERSAVHAERRLARKRLDAVERVDGRVAVRKHVEQILRARGQRVAGDPIRRLEIGQPLRRVLLIVGWIQPT